MRKLLGLIFLAPLILLAMVVFVFIGGQIVMHLWNWLLPTLFDGPQITFWQALGLLVLCRILFGGFGLIGSSRSRVRRRVEERCWQMTPEERERFRQRMRERWGFRSSTAETEDL